MNWQRRLYSWAWQLATPLVRHYLKSARARRRLICSIGMSVSADQLRPRATGAIWIHAVSVGKPEPRSPWWTPCARPGRTRRY